MPELPEVETIRRQIRPQLLQQRIEWAHVTRARAIRAHRDVEEFSRLVSGRVIADVRRRGKVLLLLLQRDDSVIIRLGMSGQVMVVTPDAPRLPHTHVTLGLSNGMELRFVDPRTFGQMAVVVGHDPRLMRELAHYGYEPFAEDFTPDVLAQLLREKKALVQAVLMDQTKVVGIGKIYADESCFLAGIDPRRSAASLTIEETIRLHQAIREVLTCAIESRGTSGRDGGYRDAHGALGAFQCQLHVYQRAGLPCLECGTLIEYRPFQGRRMHFCPHCQH